MDWHMTHGKNPVLECAKAAWQGQLPSVVAVAAAPPVEVAADSPGAPVAAASAAAAAESGAGDAGGG
eukprot:11514187-Alexandrium_andersonii.AAC.1